MRSREQPQYAAMVRGITLRGSLLVALFFAGALDEGEILAHTALVLHGVFKGGHRNNLRDRIVDIFRGLGR